MECPDVAQLINSSKLIKKSLKKDLLLAGTSSSDPVALTAKENLKALAVHDGWPRFIVLVSCDPHLLEGCQRCQDRSSDPDRVFTLRRSNDLDLHRRWSHRGHLSQDKKRHSKRDRENGRIKLLW